MTDATKQPDMPAVSPLQAALTDPLEPSPPADPALGGRTLADDAHHLCPCFWTTPCHPSCGCVQPLSSRPCRRCCSWGSDDQRRRMAEKLAAIIDAGQAPPLTADGAGPDARDVANDLHQRAMNVRTDPDKAPNQSDASRTGYLYGHRDARHDIAEMIVGHEGLRQLGERIAAAEARALDLGTVCVNQALEAEALRHERDGLIVEREAVRDALSEFVDSPDGSDKSIVRVAASFLDEVGHPELANRLRVLADAGWAALAGGGTTGEGGR